MKITTVQMNIRHGQKKENLKRLKELIQSADNIGDIVVLPELFTTGYLFDNPKDIQQLAESFENSPSLKALQQISKEHNCLIVAGIAEKHQEQYFNSAAVIDPSGLKYSYRKLAICSSTSISCFTYSRMISGYQISRQITIPKVTP